MILTKELKNSKRCPEKPLSTQIVDVRCDICEHEFKGKLYQVKEKFDKYGKDLCRSCKQKEQYRQGIREGQRNILANYAITKQKGKTFDDMYGEEKSKKLRNFISERTSGEKNPNYNGKANKNAKGLTDWIQNNQKGKTYDEIYGKEKSAQIRKKISESVSGEKNPMYGLPSPQGSGNGWSGWYNGIFFRSLLELSYMVYLDDNCIKFKSAESKEYEVHYLEKDKKRTYRPDFILLESEEIIEIKPSNLLNTKSNKLKFEAARKKYNKKFKVISETTINKLPFEIILKLIKAKKLKFTEKYMNKFKEISKQW